MVRIKRSILRKSGKLEIPSRPAIAGAWRVNLLILVIAALFGWMFFELFKLTLIEHDEYTRTAELQRQSSQTVSRRGSVFFIPSKEGERNAIAANRTVNIVYSNNKELDLPAGEISEKLSAITGLEAGLLESKLAESQKTYQILASDVGDEVAQAIQNLNIKGVEIDNQTERTYPAGFMASHLIGFLGFDGDERAGQYGIEAFYDQALSGKNGTGNWLTDKVSSKISGVFGFLSGDNGKPSQADNKNGDDLVLTLNKDIQEFIEIKLAEIVKKWESPSGTIIIQDPKTGDILAMASSPSFDPNHYSDFSLQNFLNPAIQEIYEPGSSFKPITMAGAIEKGIVTPETTYVDSGQVVIGDRVIKNYDEKAHGLNTMRQVLQFSLNTGAVFVEKKMGNDAFLNDVVAFGFGQKTGIDLSGEINGNISNLFEGREINFATASFGQGIAVTPIQLINAYSAIANGGKLMRPRVVKEIIRADGSMENIKPEIIGSPISETTARTMQSMLVDVVDRGFDKARVTGYDIAGKTGTAQIPAPSGGYLENGEFNHNFVGFAPAYDARFTILVKLDQPKGIKFASSSLTPTFGEIARFLIRYFNIAPTR